MLVDTERGTVLRPCPHLRFRRREQAEASVRELDVAPLGARLRWEVRWRRLRFEVRRPRLRPW